MIVDAPPELCFEVISSAGRVLERRPNGDRVVEFEAQIGDDEIVTTELVRTEERRRIRYRWLTGPLPAVEETISIDADGDGTIVRYEGCFDVDAPWVIRPIARRVVARRFGRVVREHLIEAKDVAERRATRSKRYPKR